MAQSSVRFWAVKGLLIQSDVSINSFFIARSQGILDTVIASTTDPDTRTREAAIRVLFNVADESSNTVRAASTTRYLQAFVNNAMELIDTTDDDHVATLRISIRGIIKLSDHPKAHHRVAKQNGVAEALAKYGVSRDQDTQLKEATLRAALFLSSFL